MKITDVKVFPVDEDKLKAYATITFENCFIVRDLKVISGNKGYFIAMPSKKRKDGTFRDVAHPLNSETRKMIEEAVLEVYEKTAGPEQPAPLYQDERYSDAVEPEQAQPDSEAAEPPEQAQPDSEAAEPTEQAQPDSEAAEPAEQAQPEAPENPVEEPEAPGEDTAAAPADEGSEPFQGAEDNPSFEPSGDPEKAFGYEE